MTLARRTALYAVASATSVGTTLLTLPLATRVLGPADYGALALVTAVFAVPAVVASAGHSQLIAAHLVTAQEERKALLSTLFLTSIALAAALGVLTAIGVLLVSESGVAGLDVVPVTGVLLSALALVLAAPSFLAADVLAIDERAGAAASLVVLQSLVGAGVLLLSLFAFDLGLLSLFLGAAAGNAAFFLGTLWFLRADLSARPSRAWLGQLRRMAPSVVLGNTAETVRTVLERSVLAASVGLSGVGLYSHSQQYRAYMIQGVNPVSRSLYPVTLAEARDAGSRFPRTGRVWSLVQLTAVPAGVVLLLFGDEAIGALTNDKFTAAADLAALWMVVLAVQLTGRPQNLVLLAHNRGHVAANLLAASIAVAVGALLVLVPFFGLAGAVWAHILQQVSYRIGLEIAARRVRRVPFLDWPAIIAVAVVALVHLVRETTGEGPHEAVLALAGVLGWCLVAAVVVRRRFRPRQEQQVPPAA